MRMCRSCCSGCVCTLNTVPGFSGCNHPSATLSLSGITSPGGGTITVTASSSNTSLVPSVTVNYTSPNTTGSLTIPFNGFGGSSTITITVSSTACSSITRTTVVTASNSSARPPTANPGSMPNLSVPNGTIPTINITGITPSPDVPLAGNSNGCSSGVGSLALSSTNTGGVGVNPVTYTSPNTTASFTTVSAFNNQTITFFVTLTQSNIGGPGVCCLFESIYSFTVTWS